MINTFYSDDVFLVSYPRSGNTWLRFMLAKLIANPRERVDLDNLDSFIPHVYMHDNHLKTYPRPRIIKSHEPFNARYKKVVYLIRDPRDIVVSYYHYWQRRTFIDENYPLEKFIDDFINNRVDKRYGTWKENVGSWIGAKGDSKSFMLIKYEKLLENTINKLLDIVNFINLRTSYSRVKTTVKISSMREMKLLERRQPKWEQKQNARLDKPFFRKGISDAWKEELPPDLAIEIEKNFRKLMLHFGYKPIYSKED